MDDCLLEEMKEAKERGEDLTPYLARMERCRWDHDVLSCEVCCSDGVLPAQESVQGLQPGRSIVERARRQPG